MVRLEVENLGRHFGFQRDRIPAHLPILGTATRGFGTGCATASPQASAPSQKGEEKVGYHHTFCHEPIENPTLTRLTHVILIYPAR